MPPTTPSSDSANFFAGLIFIITAIAQITTPYAQARRYEETTGKPLSPERRREVRLRAARGWVTLALFFEVVLNLLVSPIGWATCMGVGIFYLVLPIQQVREHERTFGALSARKRLRVALALWPTYFYLGLALLSWPLPLLIPDHAAHTIAPGVLYFIAVAITALYSPVGWVLFVGLGLFLLVVPQLGRGRSLWKRVGTLFRSWPGLVLLAVALFFWPISTFVPQGISGTTSTALDTPTPLPTGTVSPVIAGAVLGGTEDAFTATYGEGQQQASYQYMKSLAYETTAHGLPTEVTVDYFAGMDLRDRASSVSVHPPVSEVVNSTAVWDETAMRALAKGFLPRDAIFTGTTITDQGPVSDYHSAALASAFAPGFFKTASDATSEPGDASLRCVEPSSSNLNLGQCVLTLGDA